VLRDYEHRVRVNCSLGAPSDMRPLDDSIQAFARDLGLPEDFFRSLLGESDWSFVIKLHAVIESAVSHLLAGTLGRSDLLGLFGRLELGNPTTGKLAFGKALNCLDDDERGFIRQLSELRNSLVHDVRNVSFSFTNYISALDPNKLRAIAQSVYIPNPSESDVNHKQLALTLFKQDPRRQIWTCAMVFLLQAYQYKEAARRLHTDNQLMREAMGRDDDEEDEQPEGA
jgi:hypothetical protein